MSEATTELSKLGVDALKDLLTNLTQAKGFILEQAPEFCQQMCMWAVVQGVAAAVLWLLCAGATVFIAYLLGGIKVDMNDSPYSSPEAKRLVPIPSYLVGGFLSIFLLCGLFIGVVPAASDALKAYVAPKVFLVETITRMVR